MQRGFTGVLNVVRSLDKAEFSLAEVYAHADALARVAAATTATSATKSASSFSN